MKKNPILIGFLQAVLLVAYISLVGFVMRSELGNNEPTFLGIILILTMFATSALISSVITLGYPVYLFWKQKEFKSALKIVAATAVWLTFFVLTLIISILVS